eukprot:CAMPEP_0181334362 /NCGR_PEP_ID=MMETSP1101-20121128/26210_1 /TAXON_ID=46948 /ORGANISM="Rhodomonas abbreviata, Strain Caron Lab Isolate" /LENGTH=31 /DNA_ID= /DNA_START= /DNA_END= /DNA_ORIENTATION=
MTAGHGLFEKLLQSQQATASTACARSRQPFN